MWLQVKALREIKHRLVRHYANHVGNIVLAGPFRGLILPERGYWNAGDHIAKIFGTYENCLHSILYEAMSKPYSAYLDIGCADGYYATGFAHACRSAVCVGFDTDQRAQYVAGQIAEKNQLSNCHIRGNFDAHSVSRIRSEYGLKDDARIFLKCDIEGEELNLFEPELCSTLACVDLLIEIHDFKMNDNVGMRLEQRLSETHEITFVAEGGRNPNMYSFLSSLPEDIRWLILSEGRGRSMRWLHGVARG